MTTSPLEALHSKIKYAFSGSSPDGANIWLKHYNYEWSMRREAQLGIKTESVIPPPTQIVRMPYQTLDSMGIAARPSSQSLATQQY